MGLLHEGTLRDFLDNLTHALIGGACAGAAPASVLPRELSRREAMVWFALANNFPDIDVFLRVLWPHLPALSLNHHRGLTHTVLGAIWAGIVLALVWGWRKKRAHGTWPQVGSYLRMGTFFCLGALLHISADGFNDYGVHPFWPLDLKWFYGETLFIIEPWLWGLLGLFVWWRWRQCTPLSPSVEKKSLQSWRLAHGLVVLAALVVSLFFYGSRQAKEGVREFLKLHAYQEVDVMVGARALNPFCWRFVVWGAKGSFDGSLYIKGVVAVGPLRHWPQYCLYDPLAEGLKRLPRRGHVEESWVPISWDPIATLPGLVRFSQEVASGIFTGKGHLLMATHWRSFEWIPWKKIQQWQAGLDPLRRGRCVWNAYRTFARFPLVRETDQGFLLDDLRYDFGLHPSFAHQQILFGEGEESLEGGALMGCRWLVSWAPPWTLVGSRLQE